MVEVLCKQQLIYNILIKQTLTRMQQNGIISFKSKEISVHFNAKWQNRNQNQLAQSGSLSDVCQELTFGHTYESGEALFVTSEGVLNVRTIRRKVRKH